MRLPYRDPMKTASNYFAVATGLLVEITSDDGLCGYGYADLFPRTGETISTAKAIIEEVFAPALKEQDPAAVVALMQKLEKQAAGNNRAKAAIEMALQDLRGKKARLPVYEFLGGKVRSKVVAMKMVGLKTPGEMAEDSKALVGRGIKALKLKIGTGLKEDVERVKRVRDTVGENIFIKVDANQAYSLPEARKIARRLADYGCETFEQPLPADDWEGMISLSQDSPVPIEADQTVRTVKDALQVIRLKAAHIINTSPQKAGGISHAKLIADLCTAAGIPCIVSNVAGSRINDAAALHVIAAAASAYLPCEVSEFERIDGDPASGIEVVDGEIEIPSAIGLGVEVLSPA